MGLTGFYNQVLVGFIQGLTMFLTAEVLIGLLNFESKGGVLFREPRELPV